MDPHLNLLAFTEAMVLSKVPTFDDDVKIELRRLGEPITYFGEDKADRRNRLIKLITSLESNKLIQASDDQEDQAMKDVPEDVENAKEEFEEEEEEEFWTPGPEELLDIRLKISKESLGNAKKRILQQQRESKVDFHEILKYRRDVNKHLAEYELIGSNFASQRAVSISKFSPSGSRIAMGSWSGDLKILNSDSLEADASIKAPIKQYENQTHNKLTGLDWHPNAETNESSLSLVSSNSNSNSLHLWSLSDKTALSTLEGHEARIINTKFHPSGDYIASSSYDKTWRFWDIQRQKELFLQEGHSKEVHALSFQKDGALIASGGLDAIGKVWDLRTGKEIMSLCDHIKEILTIDWSDNGYQLATGSKDCTIKIWDLRYTSNKHTNTGYKDYIYNEQPLFTIPAHTKLVSDLKFFHAGDNVSQFLKPNDLPISLSSTFLLSSSYDGTLKIWSADNWIKVKTLRGHTDNKIMSCDISSAGDKIVSSGWDRSVKVWSNQGFV